VPRISAVIPTRDRRELVLAAVRSALAQDPAPLEVVVVDDGSHDGTPAAVTEAFGDAVRVVRGRGDGAASARNLGAREARGDWIAFLDDDDVWLPGHLGRLAGAITGTGGRALAYFDDAALPAQQGGETLWAHCGFAPDGDVELCERGAPWVLLTRQPLMTPAVVVRRDAYLAAGGMDERLWCREDTHLFLVLGLTGPLCAVRGVGAQVTAQAGADRLTATASATDSPRYWANTVLLYRDVLERFGPVLTPSERGELRHRLATAHWRASRLGWRERRLGAFAAEAARSLRAEPRVVAQRLSGRGR
jgi:glycosyltransferase involved in cell wall biosynthesis